MAIISNMRLSLLLFVLLQAIAILPSASASDISLSSAVLGNNQNPFFLPSEPLVAPPNLTSTFYPLLPPAIPLAVRSPYLSTWLATGKSSHRPGYLAGRWAQFWPIEFPQNPHAYRLAWAGLIRVNGLTYEFMGAPNEDYIGNRHLRAVQIGFRFTSTRSIFEFQADQVRFIVTFLSPIAKQGDLLRQSLPFSYLSIELAQDSVKASDQIVVYTDIQADWASGDHTVNATWSFHQFDQSIYYQVGRKEQLPFSEQYEYAEWGQAIYSTQNVSGLTTASGVASELRSYFVSHGKLHGLQDEEYRVISDRPAGFGYSVPLTKGGNPVVFVIGHVRDPYVQSIEMVKGNQKGGKYVKKWGYFRTRFNETNQAIDFFLKDYNIALQTSNEIDTQIEDDARRLGGEDYVTLVSLSARQALGGIEITVGKDEHGNVDPDDVSAFLKEISSNGDMSTVDVIFPQFPALAYLNPTSLKLLLDPIFNYAESGLYPNRWAVHDLGRYPNATGHNDGQDEPMPVEEAGNMLIMALTYYQLANDRDWVSKHYEILEQWAGFLIDEGLIPEKQLSTDDFAGRLSNQTNLALKAIVGIGAMSQISLVTGHDQKAIEFKSIAQDYAKKWSEFSLSSDFSHTKLAYQHDHSWGTLYNLFGDRLLNLKLIPDWLYEMQDNFYPTVANQFGIPLDSRHTWAKTDWAMWAAGAAVTIETRDLFLNKLINYLKANLVNAAFPDLYETDTAEFPGRSKNSTWRIEFINRPVSGGHFSILALDKLNKINNVEGYPFKNRRQTSDASVGLRASFSKKNHHSHFSNLFNFILIGCIWSLVVEVF